MASFTFARDDGETELQVTYSWVRAYRGHRDRFGAPEEPDEPAHCELESVEPDVELSDAEMERLEREMEEHFEATVADEPCFDPYD